MPTPSPKADDPVLLALGKAIRRSRAERSVSQEELAHRCGIDRSYMGGIERGEQHPGVLIVMRVARALDMTATELFAEAEL
ncbi:MAG: hypothetical protein Tsb007_37690 [Rhizobacter sp.]